jgi:hypothetical protein
VHAAGADSRLIVHVAFPFSAECAAR